MEWNRSPKRDTEAIEFAKFQRVTANSFARMLWQLLRARRCRGMKFRREYPIPPYTADFCCVQLKLVVEVDGEHHHTETGRQYDRVRDQFLAEQGYTVLRIPGFDVERDPRAVVELVEEAIDLLQQL